MKGFQNLHPPAPFLLPGTNIRARGRGGRFQRQPQSQPPFLFLCSAGTVTVTFWQAVWP